MFRCRCSDAQFRWQCINVPSAGDFASDCVSCDCAGPEWHRRSAMAMQDGLDVGVVESIDCGRRDQVAVQTLQRCTIPGLRQVARGQTNTDTVHEATLKLAAMTAVLANARLAKTKDHVVAFGRSSAEQRYCMVHALGAGHTPICLCWIGAAAQPCCAL